MCERPIGFNPDENVNGFIDEEALEDFVEYHSGTPPSTDDGIFIVREAEFIPRNSHKSPQKEVVPIQDKKPAKEGLLLD